MQRPLDLPWLLVDHFKTEIQLAAHCQLQIVQTLAS